MRIGIKYRLFLAMFAATAAVVLCMWLIMQWSIDRGFLRYVNTIEQQRLVSLAGELEQVYAEQGDWDFLRRDQASWLQLLVHTLPTDTADPEQARRLERRLERLIARENQAEEGRETPGTWRFERRVVVLDADRGVVVSPRGVEGYAAIELQPLRRGAETVGYLGLVPRTRTYDSHQFQFVRQQKLALALIAGAALLISTLIALPLASRLVRPIRNLAAATHRLSAGAYDTRVPVHDTDELGQLARDFNNMALVLEKNEQDRRQWVADISHELRTPLAVLRGEIEALQDGVRSTTPAALHSLHAEVLRLGRLVDDLYQLSLSDLGALTYRKQELDLTATIREAVAQYESPYLAKGITLAAELAAAPPVPMVGDPERLHQLFANLLDNSLKYTDSGGRVELSLEPGPGLAVIHLRDSAPGVPPAELERIFQRLYRLEGSRRRATGGAGLGLAICRNIVAAHEGLITARVSPLGGLWITIELPVE
ncbi:ATP-binding protein [Desulfurivibrio sp. C05AmB]|uniref:ATP-binding protein n=1 Tax=Desulfurivibrio sp. C05AmB TaxID=3374371 RepID=UPI00376EEFE9